jgi:acetyl esterase/lipase
VHIRIASTDFNMLFPGLINGSRRDPMYPDLVRSFMEAGCLLVYPDYRLLPPSNCHDQLDDISDLLKYMSSSTFGEAVSSILPSGFQMDLTRVAVAGFSAGCYLARIGVAHSLKYQTSIQFKACLLFYGMGGDFLLDYWVKPRIPLDTPPPQVDFTSKEIADCPYSPHLPGYRGAIPRTAWGVWWWDRGCFLDYCTGEDGLSARLREYQTSAEREAYMRDKASAMKKSKGEDEDILPQLFLDKLENAAKWPSSLLIHGTADPLVPIQESIHSYEQLDRGRRGSHQLLLVQGGDHDLNDPRTGEPLPAKAQALQKAASFIKKRFSIQS